MKSVLVADDNINIRMFCKYGLEAEGYRVLLACDGEEAVRLIHYAAIDLAILDIGMPVVSGLEAAQRIRSIAPDVPIIFFTASGHRGMPNRWSELALACVEKSEDLSELKRLCASLLRLTEAEPCPDKADEGVPGSQFCFNLLEGDQNVDSHAPGQ